MVIHFDVDLSEDSEGPAQLVEAALSSGPIDILVNNAGAVTPRLGGFLSVTDEQWAKSDRPCPSWLRSARRGPFCRT